MQGIALLRGGDVTRIFGWAGRLLAYPMARFLGWPAAALIPLALAAHALRLFGRLAERTDRSWMVFLLGLVVLLPVALGLAEGGLREPTASRDSGEASPRSICFSSRERRAHGSSWCFH